MRPSTPPPEMIERQPYLPRFMAGGLGNLLGAPRSCRTLLGKRIDCSRQPTDPFLPTPEIYSIARLL